MSLTISLAPFQTLVYIFPTLLFFISTMSRIILTFSTKSNIMQEVFAYTDELLTDALKTGTNEGNIDLSAIINQTITRATSQAQAQKSRNLFQNNVLVDQEKKRRNSHFLYGLFIDSLALSVANGVIIMFEAQSLLYGFILLFLGVVLCSFGFTALYVDRLAFATFFVLVVVFELFLSELFYLLTSSPAWLYKIPEYFVIGALIIIAIAIFVERRNKKKNKLKEAPTGNGKVR